MGNIKKTVMPFLILLIMGVIGYSLLVAAYSLPANRIEQHVKESSVYFGKKDNNLMAAKSATLDNFTDSLMLLIAAHENGDGAWEAAINCANYEKQDRGPEESLIAIYGNGESADLESPYGRYWHGYLIFLKPLLCFLNYGEIRSLMCFFQLGVFAALLLKIQEKKKELCIPCFLLWIFLNPIATMLSLQYNTMYMITFGTMLFVLIKIDEWDIEHMYHWSMTFMIAGALTSYFDLLTYPLLSLGVPLVLWLTFKYSKSLGDNIKNIANLCSFWGIGYGCMWALKWLIGDLLTDSQIITSAIEAILFRTSSSLEEIRFSYNDVLKEQMIYSRQEMLAVVIGIIFMVFIARILKQKRLDVVKLFIYIVISMLPFVWYYALQNHSYIHGKFTYRILGISVFALTTYFMTYDDKMEKIREL